MLWLFLQISASIPPITHSPFLNWNRRSESALPYLIKQPVRNGSIIMSESGSPLSSQISQLTAGLCIFVCAVVLRRKMISFCPVLAAFLSGKWPPCTKKKSFLFRNAVFLPLGLFLKNSIDSSLNKYTTPMTLWQQTELRFLTYVLALSFRRLREAHDYGVPLHALLHLNMYKYSSS